MATTEQQYWSGQWRAARMNMPRIHPNLMGSPTVLRALLGYKFVTDTGKRVSCGLHVHTAVSCGTKPRYPTARHRLQMLAGPHGTTLAKALAIQMDLDISKYKYWPVNGNIRWVDILAFKLRIGKREEQRKRRRLQASVSTEQ